MPRFVGSLKLSEGCPEVFYTAWKVRSRKLLNYLLSCLVSQNICGKSACGKIVITFFYKIL